MKFSFFYLGIIIAIIFPIISFLYLDISIKLIINVIMMSFIAVFSGYILDPNPAKLHKNKKVST